MKIFVPLSKVDAETRMVYGYASTFETDDAGETITKAAMEGALPSYMQFANIREMHQPKAVGVTTEADIDDKGLYIAAKIVDNDAWEKCTAGVYKGFSIGGRVLARSPTNKKQVDGILMTEISLADRPVNSECVFDLVKAHATPEQIKVAGMAVNLATTLFKDKLAVNATDEVMADTIFKTASHIMPTCCPEGVTVPDAILIKVIAGEFKEELAKAADTTLTITGEAVAVGDGATKTVVLQGNDVLRKGMYGVQRFADLLQSLQFLAQDMQYEAASEGDASPLPPEMMAWLATGVKLFIASATEEATELVGVKEADASGADAAVAVLIAACAPTGDLHKNFEPLFKAGARHSKADSARLQGIHDHSVSMGASCGEGMAKVADVGDLRKNNTDLLAKVSTLEATNGDLLKKNMELEERVTTLSAMPAVPKGVTRAVPAKEKDDTLSKATETTTEGAAEPSVRDLIRKAHAQPQIMKLA